MERAGTRQFIHLGDKLVDFHPDFSLYIATRLPNPALTPELQARTNVVDFSVTAEGLEDQLLATVIRYEQRALEEQLMSVEMSVTANRKALQNLDTQLLERLTANSGNLLDDQSLINVLADTKEKANEVRQRVCAGAWALTNTSNRSRRSCTQQKRHDEILHKSASSTGQLRLVEAYSSTPCRT